ncbi:MAG: sugar ABC transporter ATP-binding protein [Deltaproteobacteria bacterium]|nr:MAG: sugar ABC transporter ATP-binding protein [Deltaproteobacteria bacterium]
MTGALVRMKDIHKYFGEVHALSGVNFEVGFNEIVGLIGDNGAGKSTLIKILSGVFPPTKGEIEIKGQVINPTKYSVKKAHKMGIETVYQEQALGLKQSLWRNIFVGRQLTNRMGFIQIQKVRRETEHIMRDFLGFTSGGIKPDSRVGTLSGGERQGLAIGRAMYFEADLIILDEPTRALSVKEVNKVLKFIQQIKERGRACVYISHTLSNIYSVSDRFVIMDRGKVVGEYNRADTSEKELTDVLLHHSTTAEQKERGRETRPKEDKL